MKQRHIILLSLFLLLAGVSLLAWGHSVSANRPLGSFLRTLVAPSDTARKDSVVVQQVEIEDETIPDSLLHPRWKVQRTTPVTYDDLNQGSYDLNRPENMRQTVEYNDTLDMYVIGNKIGDSYVTARL